MALRTKSTAMIVGGVIILAAVGSWWWTRTDHMSAASTADGPSAALAPVPTSMSSAPAPAIDTPAVATGRHDAAGKPVAEAQPPPPAGLPAPVIGTRAGARPLSAEGERRLEKFLAGLRNASTDAKDYETLRRSEPADPDWSPRLEALIQRTIDRHAGEFGQLEIGRPRCSRSLCMLTAVAIARNPQSPGPGDYQRLVGYMMQEPWFRESFFDASTTVATDATGNVFVSYFIRK